MITNFTSGFLHQAKQFDTRVFAIHDGGNGFSNKQGQLNPTGQETDIAINGPGFFIVQPKSGDPALSRRGDFSVSSTGILVDGAGSKVLDNGGAPLEIPGNKKLIVAENGDVFIEPLNGADGERQLIGTIGTSLGGSKEDPLVKVDALVKIEPFVKVDSWLSLSISLSAHVSSRSMGCEFLEIRFVMLPTQPLNTSNIMLHT